MSRSLRPCGRNRSACRQDCAKSERAVVVLRLPDGMALEAVCIPRSAFHSFCALRSVGFCALRVRVRREKLPRPANGETCSRPPARRYVGGVWRERSSARLRRAPSSSVARTKQACTTSGYGVCADRSQAHVGPYLLHNPALLATLPHPPIAS